MSTTNTTDQPLVDDSEPSSQETLTSTRTYCVYGLVDPRDQNIYYVGLTSNPRQRLSNHKTSRSGWISDLRTSGLVPHMIMLESGLSLYAAQSQEEHWIRHYYSLGMPLTNKMGVTKAYSCTLVKDEQYHKESSMISELEVRKAPEEDEQP